MGEGTMKKKSHFLKMSNALDICRDELCELLKVQNVLIEEIRASNETFSRRPEITRIHSIMAKIPVYVKKIEKLRRDMKEVDGKMSWTKATCVRAWQEHEQKTKIVTKTPIKKKKEKVVIVEAPRSNTTQVTPSIKKAQHVEVIKVVVKKKTKKKKKKRRVIRVED